MFNCLDEGCKIPCIYYCCYLLLLLFYHHATLSRENKNPRLRVLQVCAAEKTLSWQNTGRNCTNIRNPSADRVAPRHCRICLPLEVRANFPPKPTWDNGTIKYYIYLFKLKCIVVSRNHFCMTRTNFRIMC